MEFAAFKTAVDAWLDAQAGELAPDYAGIGSLDEQMLQLRKVFRLAYDAGFMRMGWPERVGGLGGSNLLRAYLGEALVARDMVEPGIYSMPEVLAPTLIDFAPPELAAEMVPRLLSGAENWCQGFSEPGTGSNLGSLACRAEHTDAGWLVNGQKVWTSLAQYATRCVLLTRTGTPESAHRGITALFVDMATPGITVRPIGAMHGVAEFCEVFYDDVRVPLMNVVGDLGAGWSVAMSTLGFERGTGFIADQVKQSVEVESLIEKARASGQIKDDRTSDALAQLRAEVAALRAMTYRNISEVARTGQPGAEASVIRLFTAELGQRIDRMGIALMGEAILDFQYGDDNLIHDYLRGFAATIAGGSAQIQRDIIGERLLGLPKSR